MYLSPTLKRRLWLVPVAMLVLAPGWRADLVPVPHEEILRRSAECDADDVFMALATFGWTVAQPAVQALMSRSVPANEQGLLQGALASMTNLTSIFGPPIWTGLFGYFVSTAAPVIVPGAAFFAAAAVFAVALGIALHWFAAPRLQT